MAIADKHTRVQESLLAQPEREVLRWLAARMPAWVLPDHLTAFGSAGAALVLLGYWLSTYHRGYLWLAVAGFIANWFGDSLDGTLARFRKRERPKYGFFIDHTVDVVNEAAMILGIGLSPYASFNVAACVLLSYFALGQLSYINMIVSGVFLISSAKIGPTEIRLIGIAATLALYLFGGGYLTIPLIGAASWFDLVLAAVALGLLALFVGTAIKLGRGLARLEP